MANPFCLPWDGLRATTDIELSVLSYKSEFSTFIQDKKAEATDDDLHRIAHTGRTSSKWQRVEHSNEERALWIVHANRVSALSALKHW
jgi:hypothetical protein